MNIIILLFKLIIINQILKMYNYTNSFENKNNKNKMLSKFFFNILFTCVAFVLRDSHLSSSLQKGGFPLTDILVLLYTIIFLF